MAISLTEEVSVERLERRLERERQARAEAEQIAERATRENYNRQRELRLLEAVASAANQARSIEAALQVALDQVCEHLGWPVGHAFLVDRARGKLFSPGVWSLAEGRLEAFRDASERILLDPDKGLAGHVVKSRAPVLMRDATADERFARREAALAAGLRGAFAVPVQVDQEVRGSLEFFSTEAKEPDQHELALVAVVGTAVGRMFERQQQHEELEREVERRTADLVAANSELEAFCYSVSHDLRAPLRSMDGFSQALLEDYGEVLDEDGCDYLGRIRAASQRMARLIDDLLTLSHVSRSDLAYEEVDLSALARRIGRELEEAHPDRAVDFEVQEGVVVEGDERLLGVLLSNLLGNAWKFTASRERATVRFGEGASGVLFVSDDGAGFDMEYADHLFGAFQRLHRADEFPGTGIGLATVERIVHRHSGRVWGEGEVDGGATFRFTLSPERAA